MKNYIYVCCLVLFLAGCEDANKDLPDNFFLKKLNNGLEVFVIEDSSVPLVTIEICVKNGAYTESPGFDGLSHLYEHMFFKANKTYSSQEDFLDRVKELGISFNGTTSNERVNYFVTLHKDKLDAGMVFMNSAIRYPLFLEEEMKKENPVVAAEFQRNESNPMFFLRNNMQRHLWGDLYSRKNVIGDYDVIYNATTAKMNAIKNKYYYPNNSILAIAGHVDHDIVFRKAEKIFGDWQDSGFDPFEKWPIPEFEPLQYSKQFIVESEISKTPVFMFAFHGPDTRYDVKATHTADVFFNILSQKTSSLMQELVDSGLAFQLDIGYYTSKYVGPISIVLVPNPQKIDVVLEKLQHHIDLWDTDDYFTDEQLQTSKEMLAIGEAYNREKTSSFIHSLTFWWASASIDYYINYVENAQKVTREDIKAFVRKYIQQKPYVTGLLVSPAQRQELNIDKIFTETKNIDEYVIDFAYNSSELLDTASFSVINSLAQWMNINPSVNIAINIYMEGSEDQAVGLRRYDVLSDMLMNKGIPAYRIAGMENKQAQIIVSKSIKGNETVMNRKAVFSIVK